MAMIEDFAPTLYLSWFFVYQQFAIDYLSINVFRSFSLLLHMT